MKPIFIALLLISTTMNAQTTQNTVDVTGIGIVTIVPDQVTINVRTENTGKDATLVKQKNDKVIGNVLAYLDKMNIDKKDVKTEYVRLSKNYEYNTKTYNYAANQSISIRLKDLKKYDDLMNGLIATGINRVDGVQFASSNKTALASEARKKAIANAKQKAEEYAGALNQTIGKAVSISEFRVSSPAPMYNRSMMMMESDAGAPQPTLAAGEMEITASINVRFILN